MPREHFGQGFEFLPKGQILSFEEIARLSAVFVKLGVEKIRLTGGEPLMRSELPVLVGMLKRIAGLELAMTTNGALLDRHAAALARAGLDRLTVSLDALDDETFRRMSDAEVPVARVLAGIEAALEHGFVPPKLNTVIRRGVNEHSILDLVRRFRGTGHVVRFIEYMDVGTTNGWCLDHVVPAREIVARIDAAYPLESVGDAPIGRIARRYRFVDGAGEIGVIASVTEPFCQGCTRARLSADGRLFTCLFAAVGTDFRSPLRDGTDDAGLARRIAAVWERRADRYSELRSEDKRRLPRAEMSYLGG
jgi:cyclic pyranopterin phosphate synthase